jgi:phenylacetate-CoA ligase
MMRQSMSRLRWSTYTFLKSRPEARLPFQPLETILERQNRKIRSIVAHAYATVPHYRDAMDRQGLKPEDFNTTDDLCQLPLVTGAELVASPERFCSSRYSPANTLTLLSSGTSGAAKQVRYDHLALFKALAHGHRQRAVMSHFVGKNAEYREMGIVRRDSVSKQLRNFYESNTWVPRRMDVRRCRLPLELPFSDLIDELNQFKPHLLTGYGSHLGALFRWAIEQRPDFHQPKLICYGADGMSPADRDLIETEGQIPVMSTYQADEALRIGFQCEIRKGFHLFLDDVAINVIRSDGESAKPGETGEIVISNLNNRATVLLNYKLGDMVTLATDPCSCGRTLPTIENIAGRANDMLRCPDGERRHALIFLAPLQEIPGVNQVQLVQRSDGSILVNTACRAGSNWPAISRSIETAVRRLMGHQIEVTSRQLAEIPREPSGKIRAVISHLDDGTDAMKTGEINSCGVCYP